MDAPGSMALTVAVCKRLGLFPLDAVHKDHPRCLCERCMTGDAEVLPADEMDALRKQARQRESARAFPWENRAA